MERYIATQFYKADSPESRILGESGLVPSEFVLAADAQRALDAERERVKELERSRNSFEQRCEELSEIDCGLRDQLATLQAQLARWKEALGEWLWNCTNLLGDYHIKTVQDFNEEVNRRIAWLMQHLDHTLPPPMTDEERDRMRKLSEDNAALQADNECKDSLIETLQAQLVAEQQRADRAVKDRSDVLDVKTKEGLSCSEWLMRTAIAERKAKDLESQLRHVEGERNTARHRVDELEAREIDVEILQGDLTTLRQLVEVHTKQLTELTIIPIGCSREQELRWTQSIKDLRAALADVDAALQPERGGGVKPRSGLGEQLYALYIYPGGTFDGDLVSKQCRDELIKQGLAWRYGGYNFISEKGKQLIEPTPQEDAP